MSKKRHNWTMALFAVMFTWVIGLTSELSTSTYVMFSSILSLGFITTVFIVNRRIKSDVVSEDKESQESKSSIKVQSTVYPNGRKKMSKNGKEEWYGE